MTRRIAAKGLRVSNHSSMKSGLLHPLAAIKQPWLNQLVAKNLTCETNEASNTRRDSQPLRDTIVLSIH